MKNDAKFKTNYDRLNSAQKQAVDSINGPVMVVAGPGTGKTQLLAMRVANILKKTDISPENILCLTFTESAATNMTQRMASIFGPSAYQVAVRTFHGLGSEIINRYGQYFYNGAVFQPADDITTMKILEGIFEQLKHDNPLSSVMNGQFTYLSSVITAISDLKKAGLVPNEVQQLIEQNQQFIDEITPAVREVFANRINAKTITLAGELLSKAIDTCTDFQQLPFSNEPTLAQIFTDSLSSALNDAELSGKTTPLTNWKKNWVTTDDNKEIILSDSVKNNKLSAVNEVYAEYLKQMIEQSLYDYDDMILRVVHALELFPSLKFDLQEQYQYILVDEFQDTNDAQMRILRNLTDYDSSPNIMIVGDDDQAIFRFQGADISNIQSFAASYKEVKTVVLSENYRSNRTVIDIAESVSSQINMRLTNILNISKTLNQNFRQTGDIENIITDTPEQERGIIAQNIADKINDGQDPNEIAVIARRHRDLENLLPFLAEKNIPVDYEREQNILNSEPIKILELLARIVQAIADRDDEYSNSMLPELISYSAWNIPPKDIWQISLQSNREHKFWLETMLNYNDQSKNIAEWLIVMSTKSRTEPMEIMLDQLFGGGDETDEFSSPLYNYFFSAEKLNRGPAAYMDFLSALTKLRQIIRDYQPADDNDSQLYLSDFINLIDTYRSLGKVIMARQNISGVNGVKLLTAHKAKGLEFDSVYIMNASSQGWGQKSRGRSSLISFPHNMPFAVTGDSTDEQLRLLFVALTRARRSLTVTSHLINDTGKELLPLEYLADNNLLPTQTTSQPDIKSSIKQLETSWHDSIFDMTAQKTELADVLNDVLARYRLSATHLNTFLDVSSGGPTNFLMRDLLRFPSARSAAAAFGTAIHTTLQRAHTHLTARGDQKPLEDMLGDFETTLSAMPMSETDYTKYLGKGIDLLKIFYDQRINTFTPEQVVERSFTGDNILLGTARLTGMIDLIDFDSDNQTITVTDYKTGKAPRSWQGRTDYEKIKLHKYRQQLLFYKLLIDKSPQFKKFSATKGILEFVEPVGGQITRLEINYTDEDVDTFVKLIQIVWNKIINLDLPNIDSYSKDYEGLIQFENDLATGII